MKAIRMSALITLITTYCLAGIFIILLVFSNATIGFLVDLLARDEKVFHIIVIAYYCCSPFSALGLYSLIRTLHNILKEKVFDIQNVRYLNILSWCCLFVGIITMVAGYYYMPTLFISLAAIFMFLILKVLKNLFATAVEIKNENELTI